TAFQERTDSFEVERRRRRHELDDGADAFPGPAVRQPEDGRVRHVRVPTEQLLHLRGADVLSVANDDVLQSARDLDVPLLVNGPEVPRAQPPRVVEGTGGQARVHVAEHQLRCRGSELALLAGGARSAVGGDGPEPYPGKRTPLRVRQMLVA